MDGGVVAAPDLMAGDATVPSMAVMGLVRRGRMLAEYPPIADTGSTSSSSSDPRPGGLSPLLVQSRDCARSDDLGFEALAWL